MNIYDFNGRVIIRLMWNENVGGKWEFSGLYISKSGLMIGAMRLR